MKSVVISVLMFSLAFIFVNCENEGQLTESASDVETQILEKKPHDGDLIIFTGDLAGIDTVMGCCPNAGPSPEYTMTMSDKFPVEFRGEHTGYVYMNGFGRHLPWAYKVQFWWGGEEEYFIEIRGGTVTKDKKSGILTGTFTTADTCWTWDPNVVEEIIFIDFTFIRDPLKFNH
jgi:hypothetical protein